MMKLSLKDFILSKYETILIKDLIDLEKEKDKMNGVDIQLTSYRWLILFLYCSLTVISVMQFLQFTIIAHVITKYYDVSSSLVHTTGTIFFMIYILVFLPVNYLIEKYLLVGFSLLVSLLILVDVSGTNLLPFSTQLKYSSLSVLTVTIELSLSRIVHLLPNKLRYLIKLWNQSFKKKRTFLMSSNMEHLREFMLKSLRVTAVVSAILTFAGCVTKLYCCDPTRFHLVLLGQGICAVGQVYVLSIPSKLSSTWFGPNEVSTACSIAVMSIQVGAAIGAIMPTFFVANDKVEDIGNSLHKMLILNAIVAGIVLFAVLIFFRSKPDHPTSKAQLKLLDEESPSMSTVGKKLCKNKDFLLLLFSFGLSYGIYNSLGVVFNTIYIEYFPNGQSDLGIITVISIISGGCIGSILFGYLLDRSHQFKRLSLAVFTMTCLCFILKVYTLYMRYRIATFFTMPLCEFFFAPVLTIGIEFVSEVTYPVPEATSCSVLNAIIYVFAIGTTFAIEGLIQAFGYLITLSVILGAFVICTFALMFVSSNFRRTKANLLMEEINS